MKVIRKDAIRTMVPLDTLDPGELFTFYSFEVDYDLYIKVFRLSAIPDCAVFNLLDNKLYYPQKDALVFRIEGELTIFRDEKL